MSANVKLSTGTGKILFLTGTYVDSTGATKYITLKQANNVQPGSWQNLSGACTIPDGVTEITFYVQVYLDADVSLETIQEKLYVDNAKLTIVQ